MNVGSPTRLTGCRYSQVVGSVLVLVLSLIVRSGSAAESEGPQGWTRFAGCQLVPRNYNDGDSFHVRCGRREYIFRLYFVDTPEVDNSFPARVRDQCEYFNVTPEDNLRAGEWARALTAEALQRPFVVWTRWRGAMGQSRRRRYYALVEVGTTNLAELLVARGLARIKGAAVNLPNGERAKTYLERLRALESEAKPQRMGAWAASKPGPTERKGRRAK